MKTPLGEPPSENLLHQSTPMMQGFIRSPSNYKQEELFVSPSVALGLDPADTLKV